MEKRNLIKAAPGATAALSIAAIGNKASAADMSPVLAMAQAFLGDAALKDVVTRGGVTAPPSAV